MAAIAGRPSESAARPMPVLLRLYPAAWRERYGEEFADLLLARPPRLRDRLDIVAGAVDALMHPQVGQQAPSDSPMRHDRSAGGLLALGGGLLTIWAGIAVSVMVSVGFDDPSASGALQSIGAATGLVGGIVIAIALLLIASRYDWSIGSSGAVGGVLTSSGLVFSSLGGGLAALALLVGGTLLLAWRLRGRLVGTVPALGIVAATLLVVVGFGAVAANQWTDLTPFTLFLTYGPAWMVLGLDLRAPVRQVVGA